MWKQFWQWYERNYALNVTIALALFLLQGVHLTWLFGEVVWRYATGAPLFEFGPTGSLLLALIDYTEIPALISVSLIYINELRKQWNPQSFMFLLFLNSQWLHLFWITDEFVVIAFNDPGSVFPLPVAWLAVLIDYLELPVMFDTARRFVKSLRKHQIRDFFYYEFRRKS